MPDLAQIVAVYEGSDGNATKALYDTLHRLGPVGFVAANLFRAQKNSARAKVYRGRRYKGAAYDRKDWAIGNLARSLSDCGDQAGITWGWGEDDKQPFHKTVLYIDLPTGQVSFHTSARGAGPNYAGAWDGVPNASADRILRWVARVFRDCELGAVA